MQEHIQCFVHRACAGDIATVHEEDLVGIFDSIETMSNDDFGRIC